MSYPTLEQYQEALHSPSIVFADPELKKGIVTTTGLGLPLALCGGFALTYTLTCERKKYAVRCFHKKSNALELRYNAISKKLHTLSSEYFLDFEFQPKGIRVTNDYYPIVKMAWGAGETFGEFLENNYDRKQALQKLKESFVSLSLFLAKNGVAHGDIQNGNIMVSEAGAKLQLIDYDGMYVDEIKNLGNSECGHRNFQHPKRVSNFDKNLDRFALISIALALQALEIDNNLWIKAKPDGESLLFKANDYANPSSSAIFSMLFSMPALSRSVQNFAAICQAPYEKIPSLEDFISGKNIPQAVIHLATKPQTELLQKYLSQYPVLNAEDYLLCLNHVGDRVELIGQIIEVREAKTRRGKPYIFINFGDWKKESVKINIWSEGLEKIKNHPNNSWVGKWISVTGLMDPPYTGHAGKYRNRRSYTNLSITVTENNQIYIIDEKEAKYRLSASGGTSSAIGKSDTKNRDVLRKMQRSAPPQKTPATTTSGYKYSQQSPSSGSKSIVLWVIVLIVLIFLLRFCKYGGY